MGRSNKFFDALLKCSITGALFLALTGCQSLRTASWSHKRTPVGVNGTSTEIASTPTRRHISLKPRWGLPWRSKSESSAESPTAQTVVANKPSADFHTDSMAPSSEEHAPVASTAKKRTRFRLRSPIEFIHEDDQAAQTPKPIPTAEATPKSGKSFKDFAAEVTDIDSPIIDLDAPHEEAPQVAETNVADVVTADGESTELAPRMQERMDNIFLASATLPGDSVPGEVNLDPVSSIPTNSVDVEVEEEAAPAVESEATTTTSEMPPISDVMETSINDKQIIVEPLAAGVGPDAPGVWDNWISRLGAAYFNNDITGSQWGFLSTGESTQQIYNSRWFMHGGVAGIAYDGHTPVAYSVGLSHLARIVGNKVTNPWIAAIAYDGYYDNNFLGITDEGAYVDQLRGMLGYAICPRVDVGVWAGGSLSKSKVAMPATSLGPAGQYYVNSGARVAGYAAWNFFQTGMYNITSVGWQDNSTGNFFMQSDAYIPLTGAVNAFVGGGYGNNYGGSMNFNVGLEYTWGRTCVARYLARKCKGKELPKVGMMPSDSLACGTFCRQIDPCCVKYRGGWANDTYRSAFRVMTPAQFQGQFKLQGVPVPLPQGGSQGEPVPNPGGSGGETPEDCPPLTNPLETRPIRVTGRPTRSSNLSQYLNQTGQKADTLNK
jgi:hypothetical protein